MSCRRWLLVIVGACAALGLIAVLAAHSSPVERRAADRCPDLPPFPFRADQVEIDWHIWPPGYDCLYFYLGHLRLRQHPG
jgi:hypothetical protein